MLLLSYTSNLPTTSLLRNAMYARTSPVLLLALLVTPGVLGNIERATCSGILQSGYCCNGSIFKKDSTNDISPSNLICCEGDPHLQINFGANAPTSCTAGSEVPLTQASDGGSSQPTGNSGSSSSGGTSDASSTNNAVRAIITIAPLIGAAAVVGGVVLGA